jgi:Fe-S-cluster containining protein
VSEAVAPEAVPPDADPPVTVAVGPDREAVVHFDPALTFECVDGCTWCCHHGVLLYDPDVAALAEHADLSATTERFRGERFTRKEEKERDEHVGEDGAACAFLDGDGRCTLHAEHDWKPARCSVFPLAVRREDGVVHVTVREDAHEHCEGLDVSERRVVENLGAFLPEVLWDLPNPDTHREL